MTNLVYNIMIILGIGMVFSGVAMINLSYALIVTGVIILILTVYTLRIFNVPDKN